MQNKIENAQEKYSQILKLRQNGFKWREIGEALGITTRQAESVWSHYKRIAEKEQLALTGISCIRCKNFFKQESKFNRLCLRCKKKPGNDWLAAS